MGTRNGMVFAGVGWGREWGRWEDRDHIVSWLAQIIEKFRIYPVASVILLDCHVIYSKPEMYKQHTSTQNLFWLTCLLEFLWLTHYWHNKRRQLLELRAVCSATWVRYMGKLNFFAVKDILWSKQQHLRVKFRSENMQWKESWDCLLNLLKQMS